MHNRLTLNNIAQKAVAYKPKPRTTYKMIKDYIVEKYDFKAHTAYIAEVKRSLGLPMYDAPNANFGVEDTMWYGREEYESNRGVHKEPTKRRSAG